MTFPFRPQRYINILLTISLLYGRWSTSGSDRGNAHFFTATPNTIEGTGEKKRTNEQTLGVNSKFKTRSYVTLCIPVSIHRLTLAWISSETSTKQLECRLILTRSSFTGLDPLSCRLASLLRCPVSTASVRRPSPTANFSVPLSHSLTGVPLPRDRRFKTLCLVSRQNRQRNRLLGGPPT